MLKNHLIIYYLPFLAMEVKNKSMNRKIKVLALISVIVVATIAASLVFVMSNVKANTTATVASDVAVVVFICKRN